MQLLQTDFLANFIPDQTSYSVHAFISLFLYVLFKAISLTSVNRHLRYFSLYGTSILNLRRFPCIIFVIIINTVFY